ncbi:MAG: tol-pal system protein YbgF [Alphaproteobacteria bacterium]
MTPKVVLRLTLMAAICLTVALAVSSARAQSSQDVAQLRIYIQQLEEQVRLLTGENERLLYELRQFQAASGASGSSGAGGTVNSASNASTVAGAPVQELGSLSIAVDDPRVAPDGGAGTVAGGDPGGSVGGGLGGNLGNAPIDLSALAGGSAVFSTGDDGQIGGTSGAGAAAPQVAVAPVPQAGVSGDSRQAYDVAYGYILTGDYGVAEQHFQIWMESYPGDSQAGDAQFWLGEAQFQQGRHREAANNFLTLYQAQPQGRKAPDTLMRLGMSLAALGEKTAACATFGEVGKKFPNAPGSVLGRVANEAARAGC